MEILIDSGVGVDFGVSVENQQLSTVGARRL